MSDAATTGNSESLLRDLHKWKERARTLKGQLDGIQKALGVDSPDAALRTINEWAAGMQEWDGLMDELERRRAASKTPDEKDAEIARLSGVITGRDHKDAWTKAAGSYKGANGETIDPAAFEGLYTLSGWKAEGAVDEAKMAEAVGAAATANPYVLKPPAATDGGAAGAAKGNGAATIPAKEPGPGLSRGAPEPTPSGDPLAAAVSSLKANTGRSNPLRLA